MTNSPQTSSTNKTQLLDISEEQDSYVFHFRLSKPFFDKFKKYSAPLFSFIAGSVLTAFGFSFHSNEQEIQRNTTEAKKHLSTSLPNDIQKEQLEYFDKSIQATFEHKAALDIEKFYSSEWIIPNKRKLGTIRYYADGLQQLATYDAKVLDNKPIKASYLYYSLAYYALPYAYIKKDFSYLKTAHYALQQARTIFESRRPALLSKQEIWAKEGNYEANIASLEMNVHAVDFLLTDSKAALTVVKSRLTLPPFCGETLHSLPLVKEALSKAKDSRDGVIKCE